MFQVVQIAVGGFDSNFSYFLLAENGDAALVDPCGDVSKIASVVREHSCAVPKYILITHGHADHVSGLNAARKFFPAPAAAHPDCRIRVECRLEDRQRLPFGDSWIECLFTLGHTPDSVCYRLGDDSAIFTGDTLFIDCCGYCEPESMFHTMREVLFPLPDPLTVYSGHDYGHVPYESLGEQKKTNPYLRSASFELFREELRKL